MNYKLILGTALVISILGNCTNALAEEDHKIEGSDQNQSTPDKIESSDQNQSTSKPAVVIPKNSAVVVAFPNHVDFLIKENQSLLLNLVLAQPIKDNSGKIAIPANSIVPAKLVPSASGAKILVESIVVEGKLLPLRAESPVIPGSEITVTNSDQQANKRTRTSGIQGMAIGCLVDSVFNIFGQDCSSDSQRIGGTAGILLSTFVPQDNPEVVRVVQIPQGSVFVLSMEQE
ncbi:MAG: hypothetical protein F6K53_18445 [Moorea sp. SIO4A1]|uniref:hypothetical protein n=1 Tax=Moorena sp. SIO4A1 TaxID=2607835 RepID=UPI00144E9E23|nr:hypothetical protein [Moorena sp. SIO4A1]NEQ59256.1 hypothetical protein [Moorena sp. SIO4A1]